MTLFQARYIQWLTLNQCSLRATAGNYYARYNVDGTQKTIREEYKGCYGNQLDGIFLRKDAIKLLESKGEETFFDEMGTNIEDYDKWKANNR